MASPTAPSLFVALVTTLQYWRIKGFKLWTPTLRPAAWSISMSLILSPIAIVSSGSTPSMAANLRRATPFVTPLCMNSM